MKASLDGAKAVTTEALEWAKDKILMGAERRSAVISDETAKCTAFHEGGHAIVVRETLVLLRLAGSLETKIVLCMFLSRVVYIDGRCRPQLFLFCKHNMRGHLVDIFAGYTPRIYSAQPRSIKTPLLIIFMPFAACAVLDFSRLCQAGGFCCCSGPASLCLVISWPPVLLSFSHHPPPPPRTSAQSRR